MSEKITITYPDTLKGFAAAYAAWFGLYVACPPDKVRPEIEFVAGPFPLTEGETLFDLFNICADTRHAGTETWEQLVPGYPVAEVIRYVEDDALQLPQSKAVRAFIATLGRTPEALEEWIEFDRRGAALCGMAILRFEALPLSEKAKYLYSAVTE